MDDTPDRAIFATAPAPASERRRVRLSVNGEPALDVDSYCAGFWVTTLSAGSLAPKKSTFYPVVSSSLALPSSLLELKMIEGRES